MINRLLNFIAPHHCFDCQKTGSLLCDNCKYNIISDPFSQCIRCLLPTSGGICGACSGQVVYSQAWCLGFREGALAELLDAYKFSNLKDAGVAFGSLLGEVIPINLPATTVVVPIPTVAKHIRVRGYDHALLIARTLGKRRKLPCRQLLERQKNEQQRGATKRQRRIQAARAFKCSQKLDATTPYLLIDDVFTTGATLEFAAKTLYDAGARQIFVAVALRQPLDE